MPPGKEPDSSSGSRSESQLERRQKTEAARLRVSGIHGKSRFSDLVDTVDRSCSKYDTDRDTMETMIAKNTVHANDLKTRK